jgi:hypothetical protein
VQRDGELIDLPVTTRQPGTGQSCAETLALFSLLDTCMTGMAAACPR